MPRKTKTEQLLSVSSIIAILSLTANVVQFSIARHDADYAQKVAACNADRDKLHMLYDQLDDMCSHIASTANTQIQDSDTQPLYDKTGELASASAEVQEKVDKFITDMNAPDMTPDEKSGLLGTDRDALAKAIEKAKKGDSCR